MNEGIRLQYDERRIEVPSGTGHSIRKGDRICLRMLFRSGEQLMYQSTELSDMTEILAQVRRQCRGRYGLMRLFIRNASRGWCIERPMMLYAEDELGSNIRKRRTMMGTTRISGSVGVSVGPSAAPQPRPRMLMPWETH